MMHLVPKDEIVIVGAARTPIGAFDGALKDYSATELGGVAIRAALDRANVSPDDVDEVIMGQVVTAGAGQAPAKQASVAAGVGQHVPATQVNSVCSSGLVSVWYAVQSILTGASEVVVAGGMESRSNAPYLLGPRDAKGKRPPGHLQGEVYALRTPQGEETLDAYRALFDQLTEAGVIEANIHDGLMCPFNQGRAMIDYAVAFAESKGYTPEAVDRAACDSYRAAAEAWDAGKYDDEVAPVGEVRRDEMMPRSRWEALCGRSTSPCTAYNTPPPADAGAAVVLMRRKKAEALKTRPLVRIMGFSRLECPPGEFVVAPVKAVRKLEEALASRGAPADFPVMEMNESFGLLRLLFAETWPDRTINPRGGSVALKHPLGAAGARLLTTLIFTMLQDGYSRGISSICFGSGGACAIAVEDVSGR